MSIPVSISNGQTVAPPGLDQAFQPTNDAAPVKGGDSVASTTAKATASLNSAIVQASLTVSISSGNDPLALLLKTGIEGINEALEPSLGKDAIQNAATSQDNSAEATADRIVKQSTAFYDQYRQQNKLEDSPETRGKFIDLISGGFEKGFKEAQDVLTSLKALQGDVSKGIDQTHALVLKGFADFAAGSASKVDAQPTEAAPL